MFFAWSVASNRCALAAVFSPASPTHECCAKRLAHEAQPQPAKRTCECCQELGALPVKSEAGLAKMPEFAVLFELAWNAVAALECAASREEVAPATGPPEARSFAELVLQRSLR